MATFTKSRARKNLACGPMTISVGMNASINEGKTGVTLACHGPDESNTVYRIHMTDEELDRVIKARAYLRNELATGDHRNLRVAIGDLARACRALGEVKVEAAGSMWATLAVDHAGRAKLVAAGVPWTFD